MVTLIKIYTGQATFNFKSIYGPWQVSRAKKFVDIQKAKGVKCEVI